MLRKGSIRTPTRQSTISSGHFPRPPIHDPGSDSNQQSRNSRMHRGAIVEEPRTDYETNPREGRTPSPSTASHSDIAGGSPHANRPTGSFLSRRTGSVASTTPSTQGGPVKKNLIPKYYPGIAQPHPSRNLLEVAGRNRTSKKIYFTAISATGETVALLTDCEFWVFETNYKTLICRGEFMKKNWFYVFHYAAQENNLKPQTPRLEKCPVFSFTCAAVSDEYLAIGTLEKLLIFAMDGRWVAYEDISDARIQKLAFSEDGKRLVAIYHVDPNDKTNAKARDGARIYSKENFPTTVPIHSLPFTTLQPINVKWQRDYNRDPTAVTFSKDGNMVAWCTTINVNATSWIHVLKNQGSEWIKWGMKEVTLHRGDPNSWNKYFGFTGISLRLVLAVDSGNSDAPDCFSLNSPESVDLNLQGRPKSETQKNILERSDQNSSGKDGNDDIAIAVSHSYNAVALLNRKDPSGELFHNVAHYPTSRLKGPISMSFSASGEKLYIVDQKGILDVLECYPEKLGHVQTGLRQ